MNRICKIKPKKRLKLTDFHKLSQIVIESHVSQKFAKLQNLKKIEKQRIEKKINCPIGALGFSPYGIYQFKFTKPVLIKHFN